RQLGAELIECLEEWVHPGLQPDRTWLFDLPLDVAKERLSATRVLDRFEQEQDAFFERTRAFYLQRAHAEPTRFTIVDSSQSIQQIQALLLGDLQTLATQHSESV